MAKKTFSVEQFKKDVNSSLRNCRSEFFSAEHRLGMMSALEMVLRHTDNYKGFRYLLQSEVPTGSLPGMIVNGTVENTPYEERFPEGKVDKTRVEYF